eukprot:CAMPEP_0204431062 /NCGR_PEP_ID=MMETSP0470-20130426/64062_1 /ASSEMBLY_ACC=CAM_ASM_000385 /TAXON_ID=2969 /ORGANISM="Oxyrrhis marina" /LENGTH=156 /DNA_ID=CAMNT_0051429229 /DNA_START=238 /DNA_END=708 /DNA_ORIENTATION=+
MVGTVRRAGGPDTKPTGTPPCDRRGPRPNTSNNVMISVEVLMVQYVLLHAQLAGSSDSASVAQLLQIAHQSLVAADKCVDVLGGMVGTELPQHLFKIGPPKNNWHASGHHALIPHHELVRLEQPVAVAYLCTCCCICPLASCFFEQFCLRLFRVNC